MNANILLVDDNRDFRESVKETLADNGFTVIEAENGNAAEQLLNKFDFDLIISDVLMPERDGMEFLDKVKTKDANARIIITSGGGKIGAEHYLEVAHEFGASATLKKPFSATELLQLINDLTNNR